MSHETADQARLRAIANEVDALLKKHDVGGVVLIASNESAAWAHNMPTWADVTDTPHGLHVALREPLNVERAEHTMHVIGCLRDMAHDCANIYGRIYRLARAQLREVGGLMFEQEVSGGNGRVIDPLIKSN